MSEAVIIDAVRTPRGIGGAGRRTPALLWSKRREATAPTAIAARYAPDMTDVVDAIASTSWRRGLTPAFVMERM